MTLRRRGYRRLGWQCNVCVQRLEVPVPFGQQMGYNRYLPSYSLVLFVVLYRYRPHHPVSRRVPYI